MEQPQFGLARPGYEYADRPAAFGILERAGFIAVVRVEKPGHGTWIDLPGGAIDPGEHAAAAVVREYGEETGLRVAAGEVFARADQFFRNTEDQAFNNRGVFMLLEGLGEDPTLKIEADHTLEWMAPTAAVCVLRHGAHAWAVAAWLRHRMK